MKKQLLVIILSLVFAMGTAACGSADPSESGPSGAVPGEPLSSNQAEPSDSSMQTEEPAPKYIAYTDMEPTTMYVTSTCMSYVDFNAVGGEYTMEEEYKKGAEVTVYGKGEYDGKEWYCIQETDAPAGSDIFLLEASCLTDTKPVIPTPDPNLTLDLTKTEDWGVGGYGDEIQPGGNASASTLAAYNAYYVGSPDEKIIYLTIDCGYENGNTQNILDALEKHDAPATFFVVGHYLETAPDMVMKMLEAGHTVGSHTYHHPDMSQISDMESFQEEMESLEDLYREVTGEEITKYYRPPQGKYNLQNLQMAQELGYATFFWSDAHVDWIQDKQPTHEEAISTLTRRIHPGAIVLLHCVSQTNGEILDELLTKWEDMGYSFGKLEDLIP